MLICGQFPGTLSMDQRWWCRRCGHEKWAEGEYCLHLHVPSNQDCFIGLQFPLSATCRWPCTSWPKCYPFAGDHSKGQCWGELQAQPDCWLPPAAQRDGKLSIFCTTLLKLLFQDSTHHQQAVRLLDEEHLKSHILLQCPDTKWRAVMITNIHIYLYHLGFPMGSGCLTAFVKNSHVIISLERNPSAGEVYEDMDCALRALAYHRGGVTGLEVTRTDSTVWADIHHKCQYLFIGRGWWCHSSLFKQEQLGRYIDYEPPWPTSVLCDKYRNLPEKVEVPELSPSFRPSVKLVSSPRKLQ